MDTSLNMKHNISNNLLLSYTLLTISHITTSGAVDDRKSFKFAVRISESSRLNRRSWSSLFSSEWRLGDHRTLVADRLTDHLYMDNCEPLDIGGLDEYYYCETTLRPASKIMRLLERSNEIEWFEEQMPLKRSKRQHQPTLQASEWNDPYLKDQWYLGLQSGAYFNLQAVWNKGINGTGVTVALVDDGLDMTHPDISDSYFPEGSYDFLQKAPLQPPSKNGDNHGTRCAGQIVSKPNNSICTAGVAFGARISGLRALSDVSTDMSEALSVNYQWNRNHIYSLSWGPPDDGQTIEGPRILTQTALEQGVKLGRFGLGSIYVIASGNGGANDYCTFDGYASSIYTIAVGAVDSTGKLPAYGEMCPSQLISAYSGGSGFERVATTDVRSSTCPEQPCCTKDHSGTSAAAPFVAGIIALVLGQRPQLGWRDIQQLLVESALTTDLSDPEWTVNGAGYHISHKYGFGVLDASIFVKKAAKFKRLPDSIIMHVTGVKPDDLFQIVIGKTVTIPINITHQHDSKQNDKADGTGAGWIKSVEHVQIYIDLTHPRRKFLTVTLISPLNTSSVMVAMRPKDESFDGIRRWTLMTTRNWGEPAEGVWQVRIEDQRPMNSIYSQPGRLNDLVLTIRGVACLPSEWQYESANSAAKCPSNTGENTDRYNQVIMVFGVLSLTLVVCGAIWLVYGRLVRPKLQNISASRRKTILPISAASPRSTEGSFTGRLPNVLLKSPISPKQYLPLDQQIPPPPRRAVIDLIQKSASHSPQMATQNTVKLSDASSPINRPTSPALRRLASSTERLSVRINQPAIDMGQLPSPQVSIPLSTLPINNPSNNNSSQSLPTSSGGQRNNRPTLSRGVDNIIDDDIELQSPKSPQAKADWLLANGKPSGKPFYLRLWK